MPKAPGKYDAVMSKLQRFQPEDKSYQAKVDEAKKKITIRDAIYMATQYALLRIQKEQIEESLGKVQLQLDAHAQLLDDSMRMNAKGWGTYGANENAIRLETGDVIRIEDQPTARVIDKEVYRQWCIKNGYENKLQLHTKTTESIVKERLAAGEAVPDGTEAGVWSKVVFTKAKG